MNRSSSSRAWFAKASSILFDLVFAIALPSIGICFGAMFGTFDLDGRGTELQFILLLTVAGIEVAVFGLWLLFRHKLSTRESAIFAGALGAGCAIAATFAFGLLMLFQAPGDHPPAGYIRVAVLVVSIPVVTAIAFGRATFRAWIAAKADRSFSPLPRALAIGLVIAAVPFFFPMTERAAIRRSIELADRGDEQALEEATTLLRWVPWANRDKLAWEWEDRHRENRDTTRIAELYQRVTGMTIAERLPGRGY